GDAKQQFDDILNAAKEGADKNELNPEDLAGLGDDAGLEDPGLSDPGLGDSGAGSGGGDSGGGSGSEGGSPPGDSLAGPDKNDSSMNCTADFGNLVKSSSPEESQPATSSGSDFRL